MTFLGLIFVIISMDSPLLGLWTGRKHKGHYLWVFCLCSFIWDYFSTILRYHFDYNITWLGNFWTIVEFITISYFISSALMLSRKATLGLIIGGLITYFLVFSPINFNEWNAYGSAIFSLSYIVLSILVFRKLILDLESKNILHSFTFWVTLAFFMYASLNFFVFVMMKTIHSSDPKTFGKIWTLVFTTSNITKNVLISIGFSYLTKITIDDKVRYSR